MGKKRASPRRPVSIPPEQLQEMARAWAEHLWAPPPGSSQADTWPGRRIQAAIVQTEDRDDKPSPRAHQYRVDRNAEARRGIAEATRCVEIGDLDAARTAIDALRERDLPPVFWCSTVDELAQVLADCLQHGEQCYESGPIEGRAGQVIQIFVWYDPSHPVGPS